MSCRSWIQIAALALAMACAGAHDLTSKEVASAKRIHDTKCIKCHKPYDPNDYSAEEWRFWILKMSKKTKLKPGEEKLLIRYWEVQQTKKTEGQAPCH